MFKVNSSKSQKRWNLHPTRLSPARLHASTHNPVSCRSSQETLDSDQNWKVELCWPNLHARGRTDRTLSSVRFAWAEQIQCWALYQHGNCLTSPLRLQQFQKEFRTATTKLRQSPRLRFLHGKSELWRSMQNNCWIPTCAHVYPVR